MIKRLFNVLSIITAIVILVLLIKHFGIDAILFAIITCILGFCVIYILACIWNYIVHGKF